ncbi:MAG: PfkB family carbohydrate kinase [Aurantimonas endophytica]|uniref:Sugar/nucleoside kinase (Ribokinase family) n=1 Tax=Aurantimonas endophytica TaxID=1522175 RepID=A0A7W6HAV1_9HYPH|nr:PfkB family carbohydrate kinase [Aurantimonas endophytica]MBB4001814.1 sugar/nucleoside kinase (ribokinase family) [Aurantimonas endophytica]MCO6402549.1 carbohydrate kinase [Aurantimonas endophytica]
MNLSLTPCPNVFVAGAAHIDRRARSDVPFVAGASNPGHLVDLPGGAAFNAAVALHGLGCKVAFHGARGGDADGQRVARALSEEGFDDVSVTWLDRRTPNYTAVLDDRGELVAGIADMALYDRLVPRIFTRVHVRKALARSDAVLVDANLPPAALAALAAAAGQRPIVAIGVSPAKVTRLTAILPALTAVFLSRAEAASLVEATPMTSPLLLAELLAEIGVSRAVITDGPRDVAIIEGDTVLFQQPPVVVARDVTGAGDTLAAVALVGLWARRPWLDCVRRGVAASSLRVATETFPPPGMARLIDECVAGMPAPRSQERIF